MQAAYARIEIAGSDMVVLSVQFCTVGKHSTDYVPGPMVYKV